MNKKSKIVILGTTLAFISIFAITYKTVTSQNSKENYGETPVANTSIKELKEDLMIALYTGEKVDKIMNIETFKETYGVDKQVTEDVVNNVLTEEGYEISQKTDSVFTYKKKNVKKDEIKKYAIGEKDGYLAIYENVDGTMKIVREYETSLDMIRLTPQEVEKIKNKTYFSSDKLDEVEEEMTGLNS